MKKVLLVFAVICGSVALSFAQDIITLKNGSEIQALVQKIATDEVEYKKFDNPSGPNYTLKKSEIFMIKYVNGNKDIFSPQEPVADKKPQVESTATPKAAYAFFSMNDAAQAAFLEKNEPELYPKFHTGQVLSGVGKGAFRVPGYILTGAGTLLLIIAIDKKNEADIQSASYAVGCGNALIIGGIVFSSVGGGLRKNVQDDYREKYLGNTNPKGQFQLQLSGNGLGLAYVF
ncbi:MAG: hypothetical protein LBN27_00195 [Prevotellaceae bacterium]|jgi:hypothetical protein|nr:hypothetical protein [Prevotellaceae bacterium]